DAIPVALIGINSHLMSQYVKFVVDFLLKSLRYAPIYNVVNPFDFMDNISLIGKANFFETRVSQYSKASVG
ncbi:ferritin-like superfamily, partial [Mycena floridula]